MGTDDPKIAPLWKGNWRSWRFNVKMVLTRRKEWLAVERKAGVEVSADVDQQALATLSLLVHKSLHHLIRNVTTASAAWKALEGHFAEQTNATRLQLLDMLAELKLGEQSIDEDASQFMDLQDELNEAVENFPEILLVATMLRGLPDVYDTHRTIIKSQMEELTLKSVHRSLLRAEAEISQQEKQGNVLAMQARVQGAGSRGRVETRTCHNCGEVGHLGYQCTKDPIDKEKTLHEKLLALMASEQKNMQKQGIIAMSAHDVVLNALSDIDERRHAQSRFANWKGVEM